MKNAARVPGLVACKTLPLVYVNMPKSGCTTVKNLMHRLDTGSFLDDPLTIHKRRDLLLRAAMNPKQVISRLKTDTVFTFVRHPLKRAYSGFNEKLFHQTIYSFPKARDLLITRYGGKFTDNPSVEQHRDNFKRFLTMAREVHDPHWMPQSTVLMKAVLPWRFPDIVAKVEKFDEMMPRILEIAGASMDMSTIPRMNEGPPPPHSYEDIIDEEIKDMAKNSFAKDFRWFGYRL